MITAFCSSVTGGRDQAARTTQPVYDLARRLAGVPEGVAVFDPCPPDPTFDGLEIAWHDWNYVNPPFREAERWIDKGKAEGKKAFFLLPLRASRRWFADRLVRMATVSVLCQPVRFAGYRSNFPLPVFVARMPPAVPPEGHPVRQYTVTARDREVPQLPWDGPVTVLSQSPSAALRALPAEATVVLPVTLFKTRAFQERLRDVRDVAWVRATGAKSFIGSAAVRFAPSEPPVAPSPDCLFLVRSEDPLFPSQDAATIV